MSLANFSQLWSTHTWYIGLEEKKSRRRWRRKSKGNQRSIWLNEHKLLLINVQNEATDWHFYIKTPRQAYTHIMHRKRPESLRHQTARKLCSNRGHQTWTRSHIFFNQLEMRKRPEWGMRRIQIDPWFPLIRECKMSDQDSLAQERIFTIFASVKDSPKNSRKSDERFERCGVGNSLKLGTTGGFQEH